MQQGNQQPYRFIISGGGTGGHIFPAIAIANELKALDSRTEILFVGAQGRMEMQKVPAAGYKIKGLWISGIQRRLTKDNLMFPLKVLSSVLESRRIIREFKPHAAIGVGGYASGPLLYAAAQMGVPTLIQEQNSFAGLTNKWLSGRAKRICVAYDNLKSFFPADKTVLLGNPVRKDIAEKGVSKAEALSSFGLSPDKKTFLVIGGSLGARTINESIALALPQLADAGYQLIWQTGKGYIETAAEQVKPFAGKGVMAEAFITDMSKAYAAADVVISRAGALSISELCLVGKPCILVPSPNVAEDHQTKNAMELVKSNAAQLIKDAEAREKLPQAMLDLMKDEAAQENLSQEIHKLAKPNAAQDIAKEILKLVK
jgi:UDP-N-acetylglucosamine--N-acetylmuramyl-(pentapeptide) pyrophosphoryl-undecaprenol N-acetylglucosamine transferase